MLSIKTEAVTQRAAIIDGAATMVSDNKLKLVKVIVDIRNRVAYGFFEIGAMLESGWNTEGRDVPVIFDTATGRANPLHDDVWTYFMEQATGNGGDPEATINIALVENVAVDRQLLLDWIDNGGE